MRVLVCGGRACNDWERLFPVLDNLKKQHKHNLIVIQGGAQGADALAKRWCRLNLVHCAQVDALWFPGGVTDRTAGPKRNSAMLLLNPELVVALPGGRGTTDMVTKAKKNDIPIIYPVGEMQ
jgi:hypothetical protein